MEAYTQLTLRDYLKVLFRQKAVIITAFLTVMITVFVGLKFKTPVYSAAVKMLISAEKQVESPYYREIIGARNLEVALTQSEIVTSRPVIERAVKATGLFNLPLDYEKNFASRLKKPFISLSKKMMERQFAKLSEDQRKTYLFRITVESLKERIKVEPVRDTNLFTISVSDYSPIGAAILANVISRSYVIFDLEQQLAETQLKYGDKHPTAIQLKDNIDKMIKNLDGQPLPDVEAIGPASVKILEQATLPLRPSGIPRGLTLVLAFFMSIFLSIMLAFAFEYLDQTFKSPEEVERVLGFPYLGFIPKNALLISYHDVADQIYLLAKDRKMKTILFSSAVIGEGVSNTIVNLANYFSKTAGHKTLIIDTNLREPTIHKLFYFSEVKGLVDVLEGKMSFDKALKEINPNLAVLPGQKTQLNPLTLLDSHAMQEVLRLAKERFEIVLIDSLALTPFKDTVALASHTDGVVVVVTEGKVRRQVLKSALLPLEKKQTNILGVVLNNRTFPIPSGIYKRV